MWQRANISSSGGGTIPFTVAGVSNRATVDTQNNYLWNDNGTPKEHLEMTITILSALSAGTPFADGFIPFNSMDMGQRGVLPNNLYFAMKSAGTALNLLCSSALSRNAVLNINTDVTLDYSHS